MTGSVPRRSPTHRPHRLLRPPRLQAPIVSVPALLLVLALAPSQEAAAAASAGPAPPAAAGADGTLPSFQALEAAGARIGQIRTVSRDIFDTSDPAEDHLLYRWANKLHIDTRPSVVRRLLLLREGELLRVRDVEEALRVLRGQRFFYDVQIRPIAWHDGIVDLEVATRDTWTLDPGFSAGRSGGENSSAIRLRDYNLLGTGTTAGITRSNGVDRSGTEFSLGNDSLYDGRVSASLSLARNDDGRRDALAVTRPFRSFETRWGASLTAVRDERIDRLYDGGERVGGWRHEEQRHEVWGGVSPGLVDGWTQRTVLGLEYREDRNRVDADIAPPGRLPADERLVAPFMRLEWREDRYRNVPNRNLIGKPEYFLLGTAATVRLGVAPKALGSTRDVALYSATLASGEAWDDGEMVVGALELAGRWSFGRPDDPVVDADGIERIDDRRGPGRVRLGFDGQYYKPQSGRWMFYTGLSADLLWRPGPVDQLLLGGDNGLRGYPLRYQSGTRRVLLTVEERYRTDWFLWRLFRVGAAGFVDVGRAWGGPWRNPDDAGWLGDVGVGLRIANMRASFNNVIHVDLAMPVAPADGIRRVQVLVKAKATF